MAGRSRHQLTIAVSNPRMRIHVYCQRQAQFELPIGGVDGEALAEEPDLTSYDRIVVFFSGGKDSVACVLRLMELGVRPERIELHHHLVDGQSSHLMDWPITRSYCQAFAQAFGLSLHLSWKEGGFEREMLRHDAATAPISWIDSSGTRHSTGGEGSLNTRQRFPQVAADLRVRWCSSYLKIDVGCRVLVGSPRFANSRTLVVTGERAQESSARARYRPFEPHRADNRNGRTARWIDHWRPVHALSGEEVWSIIERHRVNVHPAYHLGWGRTSCALCIFGSANQFASACVALPDQFKRVCDYERQFGVTIKRHVNLADYAAGGTPYAMDPQWLAVARSTQYQLPIVLEHWCPPAGAFAECIGPT